MDYICGVKKFLSIILTCLILFQGAGFGMEDMLLFGRLVEHAQYHSENYGDDFLTFLNKHYGELQSDHSEPAADHSEHEELPFQHQSCNHSIAEVILISYEFPLEKPVNAASCETNFFYKNLYDSLETAPVFQPPKMA